ncbi:MAG: 6-bladed beta-propeller [Parabacteroides sp.]|uniref:6-bladed beta-propeller n=1 Tax=Macellibacteroides sp. TaxID=2014584 RepID=UPI003E1A4F4F
MQAKTEESKMLELDIDLDKNTLPFDSLMDFVSFVKLETTGENLVGAISQILFVNNKIIVVDFDVSKTITVYDESGKYLNNIGKLGQGPGEYAYLGHVTLTPDKSMVVVVDMGSGYLKYFGLDGNFVKSKKTPFWFSSCEFITDEIIAGNYDGGNTLYGENNSQYKPQLIITNLQGNVFHSGFKSYYNKKFTMSTMMPLRKFEDKVFYSPPFSDTIYHLTQKGIHPEYHLNMNRTKPLIINADMTNEYYHEYTENNPMFNGEIIELKDVTMINISERYKNWSRFIIYSKKQDKIFSCTGTLSNPFFRIFSVPKARYKDDMIVVDERASNIIANRNIFYQLGEKNIVDKLFKDLTEDNNPVLFFYKIKV